VNDLGDLVGFYVDSAGNTDGMLALPERDGCHMNPGFTLSQPGEPRGSPGSGEAIRVNGARSTVRSDEIILP
jgi:hypothetical protein